LPPTRGIIFWDKVQTWENFSQFELIWTSFDFPAKIYRISSRGGKNDDEKIHPTQKPIKLYDRIYSDFVTEGMKVIDTHLGSGSHRITAYKANIDFTGIELDKEYFDAQEKRFNTFKLSHNSGLIEFKN
jgi:site-specific DNA-methyltransferase (adenine-specific)